MNALIAAAFSRARTIILTMVALIASGFMAYVTIPKESMPEVDIPIFIVNVTYSGVSAEDAAKLLAEPIERQVNSLDGLRRMETVASEGFASITLQFRPGFDQDTALQSVKDAVDDAEPDIPPAADGPFVREIDMSTFPILTVALSGQVPERELIRLGRALSDRIETVSGVLQADLTGEREDQLEILVDPLAMETYGISPGQLSQAVQANNQLIAVGAFDTGAGRLGVSIPGTVVRIDEIMSIPVLVNGPTVLRVQDLAEVRQTFKDPTSFARIDGQPALAIDVRKSAGANIIDTVEAVRAIVQETSAEWPDQVSIVFMNDQSKEMRDLLSDLQNNVIAAVVLVMLVTVLFLGVRASLLVAVAIPGSFLGGILIIWALGYTMNVIVLFALILVVGMLVDGAIVVVELGERLIAKGHGKVEAFMMAAQRMAWPIIASTATTLAVFFPLLFWPGLAGQFMFYLPATMIATLLMSLVMALIFVPVTGTILGGGAEDVSPEPDTADVPSFMNRFSRWTIARPGASLGLSILSLLVVFYAYGQLGRGVEFFPATDAERAQVQVTANGNLSVMESDQLVRLVERQLLGFDGIERVYARTIGSVEERVRSSLSSDVIGQIQVEFTDWRLRVGSDELIEQMRQAASEVPGVGIQVEAAASGPAASRPVQIEVSATNRTDLQASAEAIQRMMVEMGSFVDIANDTPRPNPEIRLVVDREESARYGVDMDTIGTAVRLLTNGVNLGTYLPDFADDEVDIALRYPPDQRNLENLSALRVNVASGQVPISNVLQIVPAPAPAAITRIASRETQTLTADLAPGTTLQAELDRIAAAIDNADLPQGVEVSFGGEIEDQEEAMTFLMGAFVAAIFLMFTILLIQMNSFYQAFLVLTAIIFSIAGVFLGLMIRQEAFSIVMSGIGIMALAGVVVNNNIVLIDAYNEHLGNGMDPDGAARRAAAERFRPVLLTASTTVIGLLPMVMGMTIDFVGRDLYFGAPSGQFWIQLSTGIAGGLVVATAVTLLLTPTLLAWDGRRRLRRTARRQARRVTTAPAE